MNASTSTPPAGAPHVDAAGLDRLLAAEDRVVLVDFWAAWCAPCRALAPAIDRLAQRFAGVADVVKLEIDGAPELAERLGVHSIPTLVLFRGRREVDRLVGALPEDTIAERIARALK